MPSIDFRIDASEPTSRELRVRLTLRGLTGDALELFLPTWTPGSYLVREYARHLSPIEARAGADGHALPCEKTTKNRFAVQTDGAAEVELDYRVYAHELSVRTADLDGAHAFWNPTCVLLWPRELERLGCTITVVHPADCTLACSLPSEAADDVAAPPGTTVVRMRAGDLDEALDAPVLIGKLQRHEWQVDGVPHTIALEGLGAVTPPATLTEDLRRIVETARNVFGGALPYRSYVFLAMFAGEGYGGLEHRDSSTLLMPRTSLATPRGYRDFLALAAHELFHAWNVKRMRPAEFWHYDYENENYTRLLWLMEGFTAYYDDLLVRRAGLSSHQDYLRAMAKNVQGMRGAPGRFERSLEQSSFDAWIRLYRPDENTRNSSQNYYGNGAVAAMCIDLTIRRASAGARSLDDVMRALWSRTFEQDRGYEVDDVLACVEQAGGEAAAALMRTLTTGPLDPDLDEVLADVGVKVATKDTDKPFLGVAFRAGTTEIASVTRASPADRGGLAPGDELLAIQSLRTTQGNWQNVFGAVAREGEPLEMLVSRRGSIRTCTVTPGANPGTVQLLCDADADDARQRAREAWLGPDAKET